MMLAEEIVINHHLGDVISQSFGATEETFPSQASLQQLRYAYQDALANHVTVLGASGDGGASDLEADGIDFYNQRVNSWPSSDPLVTSVGGLQLFLDGKGNQTQPDAVWNDTALFQGAAAGGGGVSEFFNRPRFQSSVSSVTGDMRGTPDISMSAAVNGAANVYMGFTNTAQGITPGYYLIGGTSEASPEFAGIVALADQEAGGPIGNINPSLYQIGDTNPNSGIVDVTVGNNSVSGTENDPAAPGYGTPYNVTGYNAGPGYDLASGLGTVWAPTLVHRLAELSSRQGGW